MRMFFHNWGIGLAVAASLLGGGCVRRSLAIRTEPPGATVYFNDQLRGETPVDFDFVWYGWQSVTLRKDGFERVDDKRLLKAPFYLWIPLDFFAELLPFHVRDLRTWSYSLTPAQNLPVPQPPADAQEGAVLSEPPVRGEPVPEEAEPAHVEPGEQSTYGPSTGGVERKAIVPESAFATPAGPADDSAEPGSRPKEILDRARFPSAPDPELTEQLQSFPWKRTDNPQEEESIQDGTDASHGK